MRFRERYRRLTLWNKIGFWAAIASFVSLIPLGFGLVATVRSSVSDPIEISDVGDSPDSFIYPGITQERPIKWIKANAQGVPTTPFFSFTVTSTVPRYHVQIAPYLVIDIVDVEPLPEQVVGLYEGERGDAGFIRYFHGAITPDELGLQAAPHIDIETYEFAENDYYRVAPGESEIMMLFLGYEPGYIYTFRIGVQYRYRGDDGVRWLPSTYRIGVPDGLIPVFGFDERYTIEMHPDRDPPGNAREWHAKAQAFMQREKVFSLAQIGPPPRPRSVRTNEP